jgi:hypothetical protein
LARAAEISSSKGGASALSTLPAVFVPIEVVVAAFWMVFILAFDQDVIPDYLSVAFDDWSADPPESTLTTLKMLTRSAWVFARTMVCFLHGANRYREIQTRSKAGKTCLSVRTLVTEGGRDSRGGQGALMKTSDKIGDKGA